MEIDVNRSKTARVQLRAIVLICLLSLLLIAGCASYPLVGLVYTNVKLPLTRNLKPSPAQGSVPSCGRIIEVREPISGFGLFAQVDSNALGDIAQKNGMNVLYFADQEIFSILGIWTTNKVQLYGE